MSTSSKIRQIVHLRQILRRWRKKAAKIVPWTSSDVPPGHMVVTVGSNCKRFVIRTTYLNHPMFQKLLVQAEEEYGFTNTGPLAIPCDEALFEEILSYLGRTDSKLNKSSSARYVSFEDFQRCGSLGLRSNLDSWADSRPFLNEVSEIW